MVKTQDEIKYSDKARKVLINELLKKVLQQIQKLGGEEILDIGCGEGFVHQYFLGKEKSLKITGIDQNRGLIGRAKKRNPSVNYFQQDLFSLKIKQEYDLLLMMEVLEHLKEPQKALRKIKEISSKAIFTVPFEPFFSIFSLLSGKYLKTMGKHPDHLNFWNRKNFKNLLTEYYPDVKVLISFPWLIGVCKR